MSPRAGLIFLATAEVPAKWIAYLEGDRADRLHVEAEEGVLFALSPLAKQYLGLRL